jgi:hypothetical protein
MSPSRFSHGRAAERHDDACCATLTERDKARLGAPN